ncbi:MAG: bifunctional adenosylcobinamide kinase/adenosylcobinamide-phosphate guanylyltransferase [Clostridium sp.]|nr:bifunctional adenosylcobinamide kinase/adenosylcobinamide-phosphate guanylyltransferase [Clostridium sp.]
MFYLITGGSGSGKSGYAENLARKLGKSTAPDTEAAPLYYIATMRVWDEEGRARVRKHRLQREGKGFLTLERFTDMEKLELPEKEGIILLECLSNLTANEFYDRLGIQSGDIKEKDSRTTFEDGVRDRLVQEVLSLRSRCRHLVVVTNEVFSDGIIYDPETESYIRILAEVNRRLAEAADGVTEVVCGLPAAVKGK